MTAGIRFAVQANVYNSGSVLTTAQWKDKYNNSTLDSQYFAISTRYRWGALNNNTLDLFGGDCYIGYDYKRVSRGLGIEGIPTATNPEAYKMHNKEGGLAPKGFVFPLVTENNYNVALRTKENHSETEKLLYGQDRSFYPLQNANDLRSSRQPESQGYNYGYGWSLSDKYVVGLSDRAPSLDINYGNRVLISEPSVAGNFKNGYTNFSGLNFRDYHKQLGELTKLLAHNNYVYAVFTNGIGVLPLNQRTMVTEQEGGVYVDNAQVLAQKMQIISSEYGSDQQFSLIKTDEFIYGVDLNKNKVWRIRGGALELISDFAVQAILNDFKSRLATNNISNFVKLNYDRERNDVFITYLSENKGVYYSDYYATVNPGSTSGSTDTDVTYFPDSDTVLDGNSQIVDYKKTDDFGNTLPILTKKNKIASLYYNETLGKWIARLSWNPLFSFNLQSKLFSLNAIYNPKVLTTDPKNTSIIWEHFSESVPYCHIYGEQQKFYFEFVIVDNASVQKILNNLMVISNRAFPGRVQTTLLENNFDYEIFTETDASFTTLLKQRQEPLEDTLLINGSYNTWSVTTAIFSGNSYFTITATNGDKITKEEATRLVGGYVIANDGNIYIIGPVFENSGVFYNEVSDQNGNNIIGGLPIDWSFLRIEFGILKQNMEYIEDHLFIEVGYNEENSLIRDKAIKVKIIYEGYNHVLVQSVVSSFMYSFG